MHQIGPAGEEKGLSQVYIVLNYAGLVSEEAAQARFDDAVESLLQSIPAEGETIRYPSGNIHSIVENNLQNGLPINDAMWQKILALA